MTKKREVLANERTRNLGVQKGTIFFYCYYFSLSEGTSSTAFNKYINKTNKSLTWTHTVHWCSTLGPFDVPGAGRAVLSNRHYGGVVEPRNVVHASVVSALNWQALRRLLAIFKLKLFDQHTPTETENTHTQDR